MDVCNDFYAREASRTVPNIYLNFIPPGVEPFDEFKTVVEEEDKEEEEDENIHQVVDFDYGA